MKRIKVEWCESWIKALFKKLHNEAGPDASIETNLFFKKAEKAGLYEVNTYGSPMSKALANLCTVDFHQGENGEYLYSTFKINM